MRVEERVAYINGEVHTFDAGETVAQAFAVSGDELLAVGTNGYVRSKAGAGARVVDLQGAVVVPGLMDAHVHLVDYGLMLQTTADLVGCQSVEEVLSRLRTHAEKRGKGHNGGGDGRWILGHGFDHELFSSRSFPTREDLDKVSCEHPVVATRICGHAAVGNTRAVERIASQIPEAARQSGLVTEDAVEAMLAGVPAPGAAEIDEAIMEAGRLAASMGLTTVHCIVSGLDQLDRLYALHDRKELPLRFYVQVPYSLLDNMRERGLKTGSGDAWLTIGALKIFSDGSFGARTAALREDYSDAPGNRGELLIELTELTDMVKHAQALGFQTATHAIGDRAVETVVTAIETACAHQPNRLRHRVEHASQMTERAMVKMAHLAIPVSVQPQFVLTDFWTPQRVGPRRYRWSYPFRTMLKNGVRLAMSSDCWVERLDPYELMYRAWVRDTASQSESLTPAETLRAYSRGSAFAAHQEEDRGSLEEGKLADAVVYPRSPFSLPPDELLKLRPSLVLVAGQIAFSAAG